MGGLAFRPDQLHRSGSPRLPQSGPVIVQFLPLEISRFEPFAPSKALNRRAFVSIRLI